MFRVVCGQLYSILSLRKVLYRCINICVMCVCICHITAVCFLIRFKCLNLLLFCLINQSGQYHFCLYILTIFDFQLQLELSNYLFFYCTTKFSYFVDMYVFLVNISQHHHTITSLTYLYSAFQFIYY